MATASSTTMPNQVRMIGWFLPVVLSAGPPSPNAWPLAKQLLCCSITLYYTACKFAVPKFPLPRQDLSCDCADPCVLFPIELSFPVELSSLNMRPIKCRVKTGQPQRKPLWLRWVPAASHKVGGPFHRVLVSFGCTRRGNKRDVGKCPVAVPRSGGVPCQLTASGNCDRCILATPIQLCQSILASTQPAQSGCQGP